MKDSNFNWDASDFFERLTRDNRFAVDNGYRFARVSSLDGFHDALGSMLSTQALVAVSDTSPGTLSIENSPHARRVKLVFLAKRHAVDDMAARERCMDNMRELFRQFMSVLILEKTRLEEDCVYLDPRITFSEIDRYFFTGCACAYFQIAVDTYTDLSYNPEEWLTSQTNP